MCNQLWGGADASFAASKISELSLYAEGIRVLNYSTRSESILQKLASFKLIIWQTPNPYCLTIRIHCKSHNRSTRRETLSTLTVHSFDRAVDWLMDSLHKSVASALYDSPHKCVGWRWNCKQHSVVEVIYYLMPSGSFDRYCLSLCSNLFGTVDRWC